VIHVPIYIFYTFPLGTTKQLVLELIPSYEQVMACSLELAPRLSWLQLWLRPQ